MTTNPYQASTVETPPPPTHVAGARASLGRRLGGGLIDIALMYAAILPGALHAMNLVATRDLYRDLVFPMVVPVMILAAVQAFLVTSRGQSVGKLVARTKIIRSDGAPAGFLRGVLLR